MDWLRFVRRKRMRTRIQNREDIHLRPQFDEGTSLGISLVIGHPSVVCNIYTAEKIDVSDQIAPPQTPFFELDQKAFPARRGATRDRIVPANGIAGNRAKNPPHVGIQHKVLSQTRDVLCFQCVRHVVALGGALEVIEKRPQIRAAFKVGEAQSRAALQNVGPACAWMDCFFEQFVSVS